MIYFKYPTSQVKSMACGYFIGYDNLVDPMGIQILRRPGLFPYRNSPLLLR
nr:MAG TPA: Lines C-terminus [Caudoviricetes sp.]